VRFQYQISKSLCSAPNSKEIYLRSIRYLPTVMIAIPDGNFNNVEAECKMPGSKIWRGTRNFGSLHRNQPTFVPLSTLITEILHKTLLSSSLYGQTRNMPSLHGQTMGMMSILKMISEDKMLTLQTMRMIYDFVKRSVKGKCEPSNAITIQDKVGTFWYGTESGRELSSKVNFASSQCSDQNCDKIVL
jgi:hypothetical protein